MRLVKRCKSLGHITNDEIRHQKLAEITATTSRKSMWRGCFQKECPETSLQELEVLVDQEEEGEDRPGKLAYAGMIKKEEWDRLPKELYLVDLV